MKDYTGIKWVEEHKRWQSSVRHAGVHYPCGMHIIQKDAVMARDRKIIEKNLPVKLQMLKPVNP
jgi:hypothetical protein